MFIIIFFDHENNRDLRVRKVFFDTTFRSIQKHDQKFDDNENEKFVRDQNEKNDDNDVRIEKKIETNNLKKILFVYHSNTSFFAFFASKYDFYFD